MRNTDKTKEQLKKELHELRKYTNRAHSFFLANMSHEIRTPINELMGITELFYDTYLTDQQKSYLEMIKASSCSLLKVVNDILDFSKIKAEMLELDNIDFSHRHSFRKVIKINILTLKHSLQLLIKSYLSLSISFF